MIDFCNSKFTIVNMNPIILHKLIQALHNFIDEVFVLPGLGDKRSADQPFPPQQLFVQAALCVQQGRPLQEVYCLVSCYLRSCDSIYNLPTTFRRTGAGIGYGRKSDFTKDLTVSPASSKYHLKTIFDANITRRKGFSIYESREVGFFLA